MEIDQEIPGIKDLVNFIGIGAPKCGTEWLSSRLRAHPDIDFSKHKEINFFMTNKKGFNKFVYNNMRIKSWKDYKDQFSWQKNKVRGEFSNHYIFDRTALEEINKTFPNVKIIAVIRNPVDYLYSIYWYMKYSNVYDLMPDTFEKAIETNNREELFHKDRGKYSKYISTCFDIFGRDNVMVVTLFDIIEKPDTVLEDVYSFVGVRSDFKPKLENNNKNPTKKLRFPSIMKYVNSSISLLERFRMGRMINFLINTDNPIRKIYKNLLHENTGYPEIDLNTKNELKKYYVEDISKLEKLLNRDLSRWK